MDKAKVYFTREITPENVIKMYEIPGITLPVKVAVKVHSGGKVTDRNVVWDNVPEQEIFLQSMADAALSVVKHFENRTAFVSMACNLSVDCDCCAVAEDPCMKDIGILASLDPVAIDRACIDLVKNSDDPGKEHFLERVNSRKGTLTIDYAAELGFGTKDYELIEIK